MTTGNTFQDVVDSQIHSIVDLAAEQAAQEIEGRDLFSMYQVSATDEKLQGISGAGYGRLTLEGQQYAANQLWRDYPASITVRKYTSELTYTEEDVYYIEQMKKGGNATGAQLRLNSIASQAIPPLTGNINADIAKMFYLGFGSTFFTGGDSQCLIDSDHPIRKTGSTQSNTATKAFSPSELTTAVNAMNLFQGQNGRRLKPVRRLCVVCHSNLLPTVQQALDSQYGPLNANLGLQTGSRAAFKGRGVEVSYLALTEIPVAYANYWWVVDLDRAQNRFFLAYAWMPRSAQETVPRNGTFAIDSSTVIGPTALGWQWIYGSTGTT